MLQAIWKRVFVYEGNLVNLEDLRCQLTGRLAALLIVVSVPPMLLYLPQEYFSLSTFGLLIAPLALGLNVLALTGKHPALARHVLVWGLIAELTAAISMFRAYFDGIPHDLEEAAHIDGCSRLQGFALIVLPLAGPAIAAVAIFTFLFSYNEYLVANIFLRNEKVYTIPVGIQMFMQQFGTEWGSLMAASTLAMLPTFVLFLFVQKYVMYGAVGSGVTGT